MVPAARSALLRERCILVESFDNPEPYALKGLNPKS